MVHYIFIYIVAISISISGGCVVWRYLRNISGFFFLVFTIFSSLGFITHFFLFSSLIQDEIILYISRLLFGLSIVTLYSLLCFIYYFGESEKSIHDKKVLIPLFLFFGVLCLYICTDLIVSRFEYDAEYDQYRSTHGSLFPLHIAGHFEFIFLFFHYIFQKLREQEGQNKVRLRSIFLSLLALIISFIILRVIIPFFGVHFLENELVILVSLFVLSVLVIIRRYSLSHDRDWVGRFFIVSLSLLSAYYTVQLLQYGAHFFDGGFLIAYAYPIDILGTVLFFIPFYVFFSRMFLGDYSLAKLFLSFENLKKSISQATDIESLNALVSNEMYKIFKPYSSSIQLYGNDEMNYGELRKYFDGRDRERFFINDPAFIENNRHLYDKNLIVSEIPRDSFLIFPLYDTGGKNIGIFLLGSKGFGEYYSKVEIEILQSFSLFLEMHIKYVGAHMALQDISKNMDKKVDEKLVEYNAYMSRQSDFIGMVSHEIKSPISAAIFQSSSIIDDMSDKNISQDALKNEISILNSQLVRTGGLLSKLFSVQYYDTHDVTPVKEELNLSLFLQYEIEYFSNIHKNVKFDTFLDESVGIVEIDRIQFQQVISNLLENSVKFLDDVNPMIVISLKRTGDSFTLIIEDNGRGFQGIDIHTLFDKYTTGSKGGIGLGMGLYLCRKIVSLHQGTIEASQSSRYSGAKFTICVPIR